MDKNEGENEFMDDSDDEVDVVLEAGDKDSDPTSGQPDAAAAATSLETVVGQGRRSIIDMEIEDFEEHPWRKPGADLTDYFNYGFTEDTWKAYCQRQSQMRAEASHLAKIKVFDGAHKGFAHKFGLVYRV